MGSGPLSINSVLSQLFGQASAAVVTSDPETTVAIRILGRVQAHVFGRWRQAQRQGIPCALYFEPPGGARSRCSQPMVGLCSVCHRPVCLSHSAVHLETGTPLCFGCIELARQVASRAPAPPEVEEDQSKLRQKFLRRLKLTGQPTETEIQAAFRREAAKAHPDRAPASRKEAAHKRFVKLGEARDWLIAQQQAKAA